MAPIFTGFRFGFSAGDISGTFSASGGTTTAAGITPGNGYRYHVFTSPGNFVVSSGTKSIDVLIVAGGGGAAQPLAAGGGAGGIVRHSSYALVPGTYSIGVGTGGTGVDTQVYPTPGVSPVGGKGQPSTAFGMVADGGGGGAPYDGAVLGTLSDNQGGSGGGGRTYTPFPGYSPGFLGGTATQPTLNTPFTPNPNFAQYGNPGGDGPGDPSGAGGGGAGSAGSPAAPGTPTTGNGGSGQPFPNFAYPLIQPEIPAPIQPTFGPAVGPTGLYGGGGGAGARDSPTFGGRVGGPGGGGNGSPSPTNISTCGSPGVKFTGGGGGGGAYTGCTGVAGSGGDGIIIIRYLV